jgi:hypothetical protein
MLENRFRLVDFSDVKTELGENSFVVGSVDTKWVIVDNVDAPGSGFDVHPVDSQTLILNVDGAFDASDDDDDGGGGNDTKDVRVKSGNSVSNPSGSASGFEGVFIKEENEVDDQGEGVDPTDFVEVSSFLSFPLDSPPSNLFMSELWIMVWMPLLRERALTFSV